jgi:hypothetical protein
VLCQLERTTLKTPARARKSQRKSAYGLVSGDDDDCTPQAKERHLPSDGKANSRAKPKGEMTVIVNGAANRNKVSDAFGCSPAPKGAADASGDVASASGEARQRGRPANGVRSECWKRVGRVRGPQPRSVVLWTWSTARCKNLRRYILQAKEEFGPFAGGAVGG